MTAPISDQRNVSIVIAPLMLPLPSTSPAMAAPTTPTTMLSNMPCWASVRMIRLASQPQTPPTISQMIIPISVPPVCRSRPPFEGGGHLNITARDAQRLFRKRKDSSRNLVNRRGSTPGESRRLGSVALLALVLVAILLDARDPQARHAAAIDGALPAGEFLEAERVALAGLVDAEQAAGDGGDHLGLAADDPARGPGRRQRVERQRLPEGADDLGRANLLVLEHRY